MKILIDPGHGGDKPGAVYEGEREEDITLAVGLRAANVLRTLGHEVFLTRDRDEDISLSQRLKMIEEFKVDAFISIHANASASGAGANGVETYYRDDRDWPLANCVQQCLTGYSGMKNGGILQDIHRLNKRLTVLNNLQIPSVLTEIGYLSNPENREYITKNMSTIGEVIAHGVDWYSCLKAGKEKEVWPV